MLDDLRRAFETAEAASPGFSEIFLRETLSRLLPSVSDARIKATVSRMSRLVFIFLGNVMFGWAVVNR